ncbi:SDR family NAD(P)-dependent oxidoreductase [Streptomyces sp. V4I23]|uniref:SDR family NAD(P)-dependent oxidoreductase n=1 Tax=Streptomyces sp. V4I23 TaxID=3042282 RepID=UPI00358F16F0
MDQVRHERRLRGILRERFRYACARPADAMPEAVVREALSGLTPRPSETFLVDTASASSLYALELAMLSLLQGDSDVAVVGGLNNVGRMGMTQLHAFKGLSASGRLRAFDREADGTLFAESAAVIVLKPLERAQRDGDHIHGVIRGLGTSNDGRGRAISAPNPKGQRLAIERAFATSGLEPADVGWVVAHGGGSPVGDEVELAALQNVWGDNPLWCTSNKSQAGHGCWASGVVSVIHALLGLRHAMIPAQRQFTAVRATAASGSVRVPTSDIPLASGKSGMRTVAVNSIGLGGTNAHLLLQDAATARTPSHTVTSTVSPELALIGWSAHLPADPGREEVVRWLSGDGPAPVPSFAAADFALPFDVARLPPTTLRAIDRTHIVSLSTAASFVKTYGELWQDHREHTGVIAAHGGPSPRLVDAALRAASAEATDLIASLPDAKALRGVLSEANERAPMTEESMAGVLPGVAASRIANRWDLNGPTMSFDGGPHAGRAALQAAARYLKSGQLSIALVLGISSGRTSESAEFSELPVDQLAEGGFLIALALASEAESQGWPILARIPFHQICGIPERQIPALPVAVEQGALTAPYFGAAPILELLKTAMTGGRERSNLPPKTESDPTPTGSEKTVASPTSENLARAAVSPLSPGHSKIGSPQSHPPGNSRFTMAMRRCEATPLSPSVARLGAIPQRSVILTNSAEIVSDLAARSRARKALVLSTDPATPTSVARTVSLISGEGEDCPSLNRALDEMGEQQPHIRVLVSVPEVKGRWPGPLPRGLTTLQELLLLVLKRFGDRMASGSLAVVIQDPQTDGCTHPYSCLFTGMVRSLAWEIPPHRVLALVTDAETSPALTELANEFAAIRDRAVIYYRTGLRHTERMIPAPLASLTTGSTALLHEGSVVVAAGGARGITAACLIGLAERFRPKIWLLGTTPLEDVPHLFIAATDEDEGELRRAYISASRKSHPGPTIGEINRQFTMLWRAREAAHTLQKLRTHCGEERVHYLVCDLTDPLATRRAIDQVHSTDGPTDLLIHAAARSRPGPFTTKPLRDFRDVLNAKVGGYLNLRQAYEGRPPGWWCNFGSDVITFGMAGDADYVAANEFLAAAASYESRLLGGNEFTIGWGLWTESGFASGQLERERTKRFGLSSGLSDNEGIQAFLSELALPRSREPAPLWSSPDERALAEQRSPGITDQGSPESPSRHLLLGLPDKTAPGHLEWTWTIDKNRDRHLGDHMLDGRPMLAGMTILAIAAEAATELIPSVPPIGFRDIQFSEFVWADHHFPGKSKYRVRAELITPDRVRVTILSAVRTPDGRLLIADREHARVDVLFGVARFQCSVNSPLVVNGSRQIDPTYSDTSPLRLYGAFRNTTGIEADTGGAIALWHARIAGDEIFARLPIPVLLLDALVRTTFYARADHGQVAIRVVKGISALDLYSWCSDQTLADRNPAGVQLHCDSKSNDCIATANGQVIAKLAGVDTPLYATVSAVSPPLITPPRRLA